MILAIQRAVSQYNVAANGDVTMYVEAHLVNTDVGGNVQQETVQPAVVFAHDATLEDIEAATVDAIVDAASSGFSWTLPRENCLVMRFARGS